MLHIIKKDSSDFMLLSDQISLVHIKHVRTHIAGVTGNQILTSKESRPIFSFNVDPKDLNLVICKPLRCIVM